MLLLALTTLVSDPIASFVVTLRDPAERRAHIHVVLRELDPNEPRLALSMPEGTTYISLPEPLLDGPIHATSGGRELEVQRESLYSWSVAKANVRELELDYTVALKHRDVPEVKERDAYEHPYVDAAHGMLTCGTLFLAPATELNASVRFELPQNWPVFTSWRADAPFEFSNLHSRDLRDGLIAIGDWKPRTVEVGGARIDTLFAPSEREFETTAGPLIDAIVKSELELFASRPFEHFLFVFTPSDVRGFAGSAKQGGLVLSVSHSLPAQAVRGNLAHLVAHEFFHTWASAHYHAPDELRFVNEGFTDYFANHVAARVGALSWDEFAGKLADCVRRYEAGARASKLSLVDAGGLAFFESREAYDQIYCGGLLIAAMCELEARRHEPASDLDAFQRALNNDPRWSPGEAAPSLDEFVTLLARHTNAEFATHVRTLLSQTEPIDFVGELARLGCRAERSTQRAALDLRANLDGTRLVDLDPNSALASLGLRAGDVIVEVGATKPVSAKEVYAAFRALAGDRVRMVLRRGADDLVIDEPVPNETRITIEAAPWRR